MIQKISHLLSPTKLRDIAVALVMALIVFSVLWRGGKSIDSTWILIGVTWLCSLQYWLNKPESGKHLPLALWCCIHLYALWTLLSYLQSDTQNYGFDELVRAVSLTALFLWSGRAATEEGIAKKKKLSLTQKILFFTSYATVVACMIGCLVYVFQPVNRFVGTFFDARFHTDYWPNAWGQYLLLTWPVVAWWSQSVPGHFSKKYKWTEAVVPPLLSGFVLGCFFLSYSRGSFVAFAGQLILGAGLLFLTKNARKKLPSILTMAVCTVAVASCVFLVMNAARGKIHPVQSMTDKITFQAAEGTSSVTERQSFWQAASVMARSKPMLGWGPYSFRFIQPRLQTGVRETSDHAHNVLLKLASERGYLTALFFLSIFVSVLLGGLMYLRKHPEGTVQNTPVLPALLIGTSGVMAHNLIDFNLQFVGIALPFWLFLGLASSVLYRNDGSVFSKQLIIIVEMLLLTSVLIWSVSEARYLLLSSVGRHLQQKGSSHEALGWYEMSLDEWFSRDMHLSRAQIYLENKEPVFALSALDKYMKQNLQDARAWKLRGDACALIRDRVCTLTAYELAYDYNRQNDLSAAFAYIRSLVDSGRTAEVEQRRREFEFLMNDYALAIQKNAHFISLSSDVETLIEMADYFAELFPEQEPQYIVLGARVRHKADEDRKQIISRPPGYLW